MKPDAERYYRPDPAYLRDLLERSGFSIKAAAQRLGMTRNGFRNYLRDESDPLHRKATYCVQFALEALAEFTPTAIDKE